MAEAGFDLAHVRFQGAVCAAPVPAADRVAISAARAERRKDADPDAGHDPFARWVLTQAGIDAALYRPEPLRRRVPACLRALRATSAHHARQLVEARPDTLPLALSALLIGVTDFFRDRDVFESLARMLRGWKTEGRPLRAWSAGCASGAELYSLAMLLSETGVLEASELLGTDCREQAVGEAAAGVYDASALKRLPQSLRNRYFNPAARSWRVVEPLRLAARWKIADLSRDIEAGPWDVILWRNVAIYLEPVAAAAIGDRLRDVLRPGGCLVVGSAEQLPSRVGFSRLAPCLYRRTGGN